MLQANPLKRERLGKGWRQIELAKFVEQRTGLTMTQWKVSMLEHGLYPSKKERKALCEVLEVSESLLFPPSLYPLTRPPAYFPYEEEATG